MIGMVRYQKEIRERACSAKKGNFPHKFSTWQLSVPYALCVGSYEQSQAWGALQDLPNLPAELEESPAPLASASLAEPPPITSDHHINQASIPPSPPPPPSSPAAGGPMAPNVPAEPTAKTQQSANTFATAAAAAPFEHAPATGAGVPPLPDRAAEAQKEAKDSAASERQSNLSALIEAEAEAASAAAAAAAATDADAVPQPINVCIEGEKGLPLRRAAENPPQAEAGQLKQEGKPV
eukprot:1142540-Pelagomonas_calceolata.AAC.4